MQQQIVYIHYKILASKCLALSEKKLPTCKFIDIISKMEDVKLILAVETSGRQGSVAIADGAKLLEERRFQAPMTHSAELFPAIENLLEKFDRKQAEIKEVYISIGPGSFTGLRIAVTFAKMMNLSIGAKIVAVNTLDVIAENATAYAKETTEIQRIATILDAKRSKFFIAFYELKEGKWVKILSDSLMSAEEFLEKNHDFNTKNKVFLLGEGLVYYKDNFAGEGIEFLNAKSWVPGAGNVYKLGYQKALRGDYADAVTLTPFYMRGADAKIKG